MVQPSLGNRPRLLRYVLFAIGWLSVALGVIGIFLPVLPTTPFLLLAAACFARSWGIFACNCPPCRRPPINPAFGLPAIWIDANLREHGQIYGYTVVDASTVTATHHTTLLCLSLSA